MNINMRTEYNANEKYCNPCFGAGKMMGGGMIYKICFYCKGKGKVKIGNNEIKEPNLKKRVE